jgi:cholesterol oxidase
MSENHWDVIIVGSGFGGSVSALRLAEKGYRVLVVEKGKRFAAKDFPKTNWDLKRFMWMPAARMFGPFKMRFFRHITIVHGVGVGGGSLVYANTLPVPKDAFYESGSWAGLRDWKQALEPYYALAKHMLGATKNPVKTLPDEILGEIAKDLGREDHFHPTEVAVYFGTPGETVPDPYFKGKGPERTGCNHCGGCMTGCRHGSKNTLDKNYLYLAERLGAVVMPETEVTGVHARDEGGYAVDVRRSYGLRRHPNTLTADRVVLSAGVLGTVELLLKMKEDGLPSLSNQVGRMIRTNSESLIGVTTRKRDVDLSKGIAISSILHTDDHSHVEPVRYAEGSGFFRTMTLPHAGGQKAWKRLASTGAFLARHPMKSLSTFGVPDWAKYTTILLYMRSLEGTITFTWNKLTGLGTQLPENAEVPTASIPEATDIAKRFANKIDGVPMSMFTETLLNIPTTAHILGGACIGETIDDGVIGADQQVHGYPNLYVCDGSAMSANPGVNPSLTITAMTELAMTQIPAKSATELPTIP